MAPKIKYPVVDGKKECGDCHLFFSISEYPRARNHYVSYCPRCKAIRGAKYRSLPENKIKIAEYHKEYKKDPKHRSEINARQRRYNKTDKYKVRKNKNRRDWSFKQKQKAVDYKGGECVVCGYSKCLAALDFHHKNPLEKDGYGTGSLKSHWSWERNKIELDKCVLVCVRCHREIHAGLVNL